MCVCVLRHLSGSVIGLDRRLHEKWQMHEKRYIEKEKKKTKLNRILKTNKNEIIFFSFQTENVLEYIQSTELLVMINLYNIIR